MIKLTHPALASLIAALAVLVHLATWQANRDRAQQDARAAWQTGVEQRLARLETKLDRLLGVGERTLALADRRLPRRTAP